MNEIEVGEYVRTDTGEILKVLDTEKGSIKAKYLNCIGWIGLCRITKHSKNIIDLIEVGDFVNGDRVYKITCSCIYLKGKAPENKHTPRVIESILTHEQYESNCYKLGDE